VTDDPLTVRATVLGASVFPNADRQRLWLVRLRVEEVIEGELSAGQEELSILVHSPSRDFRTAEPVGETFRITLKDPLTDPYAGGLKIARDE